MNHLFFLGRENGWSITQTKWSTHLFRDSPGHASSWCTGYPEICPSPTCTQPLNPATNKTFDILSSLFQDLTGGARGKGLFPDNVMHLGGDEVNTACWTQTPSIAKWLNDNGLTTDGGYEYFVKRAQAIAHGFGRDVVGWEEIWFVAARGPLRSPCYLWVRTFQFKTRTLICGACRDHFGTSLDKSTIIHQWLPGSTIAANATSHGYRVLWSTDGVWYLGAFCDCWQPDLLSNSSKRFSIVAHAVFSIKNILFFTSQPQMGWAPRGRQCTYKSLATESLTR